MVAQRRCWDVDVALDVSRRGPRGIALDDESQDLEPRRMTERAELRGVLFEQRRDQAVLLDVSNQARKATLPPRRSRARFTRCVL